MKTQKSKIRLWLGLALIAAAAWVCRAVSAAEPTKAAAEPAKTSMREKKTVLLPAETIELKEVRKGVAKAELWGEPKGPHGALTKFLAGTKTGMHVHTRDVRIIVISGTILHGDADGTITHLGPGSYRFIPGGVRHTTACADGADCLFYEELPGEFDLKMAEKAPAKQ